MIVLIVFVCIYAAPRGLPSSRVFFQSCFKRDATLDVVFFHAYPCKCKHMSRILCTKKIEFGELCSAHLHSGNRFDLNIVHNVYVISQCCGSRLQYMLFLDLKF